MRHNALVALTVPEELKEIENALGPRDTTAEIKIKARALKSQLKLKRTFNQFDYKFWRVIGPANHPFLNSDLSLRGMQEWEII